MRSTRIRASSSTWASRVSAPRSPSSPSKTSSMFLYASATASHSESTRRAGWDKSRGTVGGSTLVLCNEVVPGPKDDQDIITPLKSFITGVFPKF